jgi:hypothetical protein
LNEARADYAKLLESFRELEADKERLQARLEIAETRSNEASASTQQQRQFPTTLELLNKLLKRRKKSTAREVDIEIILDILGSENDANLS